MTKLTHLALSISLLLLFCVSSAVGYEGGELGYIDAVTVNGVHFEDLDENEIVFYPEDLRNGMVEIRGLLEEEGDTPLSELAVEVTVDGGFTWQATQGNGDWAFAFEPVVERPYEFSLRVVKATPIDDLSDLTFEESFTLVIGPFTLHAKGTLKNRVLKGTGSIDVGELGQYLPENLLDSEGKLKVTFNALHLNEALTKVALGQIKINMNQQIPLFDNGQMTLKGISFTATKANLMGTLSFHEGLLIPVIPFYDLSLSPQGISGLLEYRPRHPLTIPLVTGTYGVSVLLKSLALDVDTAKGTLGLNNLDASLHFADAFGEIEDQLLGHAHGVYQWGSRAAAEAQATSFTLPGTAIVMENIGGEIKETFSGVTVTGKLKIPCYGKMVEIDLDTLSALEINTKGLSTLAPIVRENLSMAVDISGFEATLKRVAFEMQDNILEGAIQGKLALTQLGQDAAMNITADIGSLGIHRLKADIQANKVISIPSFADVHLSKIKLTMTGLDLSVSLDGGITLTNPALQGLSQDSARDLFQEKVGYFERMGKTGVGQVAQAGASAKGALTKAKTGAKNQATKQGRHAAQQLSDFSFQNLKIMKDRLELPASLSGWHPLATPLSATIDSITLSASSWGIGSDAKGLWAGIKGDVSTSGTALSGNARATAQFFSDGTYRLLDFAANASLTIGEFTLHTDAALTGDYLTGSGVLVSNLAIPSLPDALKDSDGRLNLAVNFTDLLIDSAASLITEGNIDIAFEEELLIPFEMADVTIKRLSFSPSAALAGVDIVLKGFPGIKGIAVDNVALSADGLAASGSYTPPTPLSHTFFTAPNDVTAIFKSIGFAFNTATMDFSLSDMDASLELGTGFGGLTFPLGVKADLFAWGGMLQESAAGAVDEAVNTAQEAVEGAQQEASALAGTVQGGLSKLTIPGTGFAIQNPGGTLTLGSAPSFSLSGKVVFPGLDDSLAIEIPSESPLTLSKEGISSAAAIILDDVLTGFSFEGFPAELTRLSFSVANNTVAASLGANLTLEAFGNYKIGVDLSFDGFRITEAIIDAGNLAMTGEIDGFAELALLRMETGFAEQGFFIDLDADITLTHPMLKAFGETTDGAADTAADAVNDAVNQGQDVVNNAANTAKAKAAPIALRALKIYKDALSFGEGLEGWHDFPSPVSATLKNLEASLTEWGIGAQGKRFWLGFKGAAEVAAEGIDADAEVTAKFFSDKTFRVTDLDFAGEFSLGPFTLLTDASLSNGSISGAGVLISTTPFPDLPAALKDEEGKLHAAVNFKDLVLNEAEAAITDGLISLDANFDISAQLTEAKALAMSVKKLGFSPAGLALSGRISLPSVAGMVALPDIDITGLQLGPDGLSGRSVLAAVWDEATPKRIDIIESLEVGVDLTRLEVTVDWDKPGMDKLKFSGIDGAIDLGTLFDTAQSAQDQVLSFVEGALTFEIPAVTLPGSTLGFTDLVASLDLSSGAPVLNLRTINLDIPVYGETLSVTGTGVSIGSTGLSGTFALNTESMPALSGFGFGAKVKQLAMVFDAGAITQGDMALNLTLDQFYDMNVDVTGSLTKEGLTGLSLDIDPTKLPKVSIDGLADLSLTRCVLGGDLETGIYFAMDPKIALKNEVLASLPELTFTGISVYKDRIDTGGISLLQTLKDLKFDLGPAKVTLGGIGVVISPEDLALSISGNINLADICESALTLELKKSGLTVPNIALNYSEGGITMGGNLQWGDNAFACGVEMTVASAFEFQGDIAFGKGQAQDQSYTYWGVTISMGTGGIQLGALPISIYTIGGGLAYHMKVNTAEAVPGQPAPPFFVQDPDTPILFIAQTTVGTSADRGYTWHGDLTLAIDPTNANISFTGDSYALCSRSESPANRKLETIVEIGASPMLFHIGATATLFQKEKNIELFRIEGMFDILFSESDWHIYVGTKENKLSVTALEGIFHGDGYLMIDSSGLMLGVSQSFSAGGSIACFYGRIYGGASLDLETSVRPFYVDAEGKVWIGIEAGVKALGKRYAIINAYADLSLKIRAPDPSFVRIKARFRYSFAGGIVSGTFRMTFWMPEKPENADSMEYIFPLITWLSPDEGEENVSRVPQFELNTSVSPDRVIHLDDGNRYVMRLLDMTHPKALSWNGSHDDIFVDTRDIDDVKKALLLTDASGNRLPRMVGGLLDGDTIKLKPYAELLATSNYTVKARAVLFKLTNSDATLPLSGSQFWSRVDRVVNMEELKSHAFTTSGEEDLTARTVVEKIYPNSMTRVVYPSTEVRIHYRVPGLGESVSLNNIHTIVDPMGRVVVDNSPWQQGLATTDQIHATEEWIKFTHPATPLRPIVVYKNDLTGEEREAIVENGIERNPFSPRGTLAVNETSLHAVGANGIHLARQAERGSNFRKKRPVYEELMPTSTQIATVDNVSRYTKNVFRVEVHDPEGEELLYSARIKITEDSGFVSNDEVLQNTESQEGIDPFEITLIQEGSYRDELDIGIWKIQCESMKTQILSTYQRGVYGYHPSYPEGSQALEDLTFYRLLCFHRQSRTAWEEWVIANPQPQNVGSYARDFGDMVLKFKTKRPLDWSSLEMVFHAEITDTGGYGNNSWEMTADRSNYQIVSPPMSCENILVVPVAQILHDTCEFGFEYVGIGGGDTHQAYTYQGSASTKLYQVTTGVDANNHYDISRNGEPLLDWQFNLERPLISNVECGWEGGPSPQDRFPVFCPTYASPEFVKTGD